MTESWWTLLIPMVCVGIEYTFQCAAKPWKGRRRDG